jgi:cobalamin synthase
LQVLITGAFHEDGFADVCDGFGGWTKTKILTIMKDSAWCLWRNWFGVAFASKVYESSHYSQK